MLKMVFSVSLHSMSQTDAPPASQESLPNGVYKEVSAKRQAKESRKLTQGNPAANQSHLSSYTFQQLTAAGVSTQLLDQIQASPHSISQGTLSARDTLKARNSPKGSERDSCQLVGSSKGSDEGSCHSVGSSKGSSDPKASSKAEFRKAAHLLKKRQEDILKRLTCFERNQAQRTEVAAVGNPEACLKWQILTPKLLVRSVAAVRAVQARCPMLPCRLEVDSPDMQPCTAVKHNGPCCFVKVFIICFVAVHYSVPRRPELFSVIISAWRWVPITHARRSLFALLPGACQLAATCFVGFTKAQVTTT